MKLAGDPGKGVTFLLRKKETEEDYGYIIDPDLVPIDITKKWLAGLKKEIPQLPDELAKRYIKEYNLANEDAEVITSDFMLARIFEKAASAVDPLLAAKWVRRELVRVLNYNNIEASEMDMDTDQFIVLLRLLQEKKVTEKSGQKIIEKLAAEDVDVAKYVAQHNLAALEDSGLIEKYCREAISENPKAADDFRAGREAALNFLLGAVMRKSGGKAEPKEIIPRLKELLS